MPMNRVVTLLSLVMFALVTETRADQHSFASADGLISTLVALESGPCDLSCHLTLAGLLSEDYARARRVAAMSGMEDDEIRNTNTRILFGKVLSLDELNAMSDVEFIARQTWHVERQAPADLILRTTKIRSPRASMRSGATRTP